MVDPELVTKFPIIATHYGLEDMPKYSILDDTWCIYCAEEFYVNTTLQEHVLNIHPDTYAASSILEALEKTLSDPDAHS